MVELVDATHVQAKFSVCEPKEGKNFLFYFILPEVVE